MNCPPSRCLPPVFKLSVSKCFLDTATVCPTDASKAICPNGILMQPLTPSGLLLVPPVLTAPKRKSSSFLDSKLEHLGHFTLFSLFRPTNEIGQSVPSTHLVKHWLKEPAPSTSFCSCTSCNHLRARPQSLFLKQACSSLPCTLAPASLCPECLHSHHSTSTQNCGPKEALKYSILGSLSTFLEASCK